MHLKMQLMPRRGVGDSFELFITMGDCNISARVDHHPDAYVKWSARPQDFKPHIRTILLQTNSELHVVLIYIDDMSTSSPKSSISSTVNKSSIRFWSFVVQLERSEMCMQIHWAKFVEWFSICSCQDPQLFWYLYFLSHFYEAGAVRIYRAPASMFRNLSGKKKLIASDPGLEVKRSMRNVQVVKQLFCRLQPIYKRYKLLAKYSKQCVNRVMLPRFQGPIEAGSPTYLSIQPSPDSLTEIHQSIPYLCH